jgi:hypothetical protein
LGCGDGVFGLVEVADEAFAGGLVGGGEGGDVGALTVFVGAESGESGVGLVDGELGVGYASAGFEDGLEGGLEGGVIARGLEDEGELVVVRGVEAIVGVGGVVAADVEFCGRPGGQVDAEAVDAGGGLGGFGCGVVEFEAFFDGMFEDDGAGFGGGVVEDVGDLVEVGAVDCCFSAETWTAWSAA